MPGLGLSPGDTEWVISNRALKELTGQEGRQTRKADSMTSTVTEESAGDSGGQRSQRASWRRWPLSYSWKSG